MARFVKIVNDWKLLTIFAKRYVLDVWQFSEYDSGLGFITSGTTHAITLMRTASGCFILFTYYTQFLSSCNCFLLIIVFVVFSPLSFLRIDYIALRKGHRHENQLVLEF